MFVRCCCLCGVCVADGLLDFPFLIHLPLCVWVAEFLLTSSANYRVVLSILTWGAGKISKTHLSHKPKKQKTKPLRKFPRKLPHDNWLSIHNQDQNQGQAGGGVGDQITAGAQRRNKEKSLHNPGATHTQTRVETLSSAPTTAGLQLSARKKWRGSSMHTLTQKIGKRARKTSSQGGRGTVPRPS